MGRINKKLLPMKAHYFLFNAGTAPIMPFIPTLAKQLGVPSSGVGFMYTIFPFIGLIAKPSFGALADKFGIGKIIFMSAIIATAISYGCMAFIPNETTDTYMELNCSSMTLIGACGINDDCALSHIQLESSDHEIMECSLSCPDPDSLFLDQMCNIWHIDEACSNLTSIQMTSSSNLSSATYEQTCLSFSVDSIVFNNFSNVQVDQPQCDQNSVVRCKVVCSSSTVMSYLMDKEIENMNVPYYKTIQFQMLFGLAAAGWACQAVVVSISDTICFSLLDDKPNNYGKQRLWGAVGWGVMTVIAGYLIDLASIGKTYKDYTPSYYLVVIILSINFFSVIPIKVDYRQEPNAFKKAATLIKNIRVILFLCSCITFGICIGSVWQFQLWYLEILAAEQGCDSVKWIKLLQGLTMGVQCLAGEAPFLFLSGWFLKKLGHVHTMTMILLAMGIRLIGYSLLVNPWYTLPIELLNGLTLGVYWSTMSSYANLVAPVGAAATLQGIFGAIFEGIGTSIGSLLGGLIFEQYGGAVMFRSFGIYSLVYGTIYALIHYAMDFHKKSKKDEDSVVAGEKEIKELSDEDFKMDGRRHSLYGSLDSHDHVKYTSTKGEPESTSNTS